MHTVAAIRLVSPMNTALELMRLLPPAFALAIGDAVISRTTGFGVTSAALGDLAAESSNRRGTRQLEWLWPRIDGDAESPGESVSRAVIEWCGFEAPELQRVFHFEGFTDRADFFWDGVRAAGESDGYGKYEGAPTERVIAEKRREDRLRRHLDGFARWDWSDTMRVAPLRNALMTAGVPIVRPPAFAPLQTLRSNPRSR